MCGGLLFYGKKGKKVLILSFNIKKKSNVFKNNLLKATSSGCKVGFLLDKSQNCFSFAPRTKNQ
jgi:hypothetical protein